MAVHRFRIVNVFTEEWSPGGVPPLTGNPLCVFENAATLSSETMQALALQFNLSETTFILPSTHAAARVRIFTPRYEMAFAGHPTLGTAYVCRDLELGGDSLQLEMQAGVIPVRAAGNRWTLTAPSCGWRELRHCNYVRTRGAGSASWLGRDYRQCFRQPAVDCLAGNWRGVIRKPFGDHT